MSDLKGVTFGTRVNKGHVRPSTFSRSVDVLDLNCQGQTVKISLAFAPKTDERTNDLFSLPAKSQPTLWFQQGTLICRGVKTR